MIWICRVGRSIKWRLRHVEDEDFIGTQAGHKLRHRVITETDILWLLCPPLGFLLRRQSDDGDGRITSVSGSMAVM